MCTYIGTSHIKTEALWTPNLSCIITRSGVLSRGSSVQMERNVNICVTYLDLLYIHWLIHHLLYVYICFTYISHESRGLLYVQCAAFVALSVVFLFNGLWTAVYVQFVLYIRVIAYYYKCSCEHSIYRAILLNLSCIILKSIRHFITYMVV